MKQQNKMLTSIITIMSSNNKL